MVTLLKEMEALSVRGIAQGVRDRHLESWHAPIRDSEVPGSEFEAAWAVAGDALRDRLQLGFDALVHWRGGLGRAGTVAEHLLVEFGARPDEMIRCIRAARGPGAPHSSRRPVSF